MLKPENRNKIPFKDRWHTPL